jgi:hypothetical protein
LGVTPDRAESAADQAGAAAATESVAWKHHHATFSYYGLTALYTCDGLEDKVKQILLYLGARKDVQVQASCARGPTAPSHQAFVTVDFDALAAASGAGDAGDVQAHWTATQVEPRHPRFMEAGDCELIDDLRTVLKDGFSWRGLDYNASCVPYNLDLGGFQVRGQVLQPAAPAAAAH